MNGPGPIYPRRDPIGLASLALAIVLLLIALPSARNGDPGCGRPRLARAGDSAIPSVRCDPGPGSPLPGATRILFGLPIDLNHAEAAVLEILPGIGPARARSIVRERQHRPFETIEDLERVRGIGPATVAGLRGWLELGTHPHPALPEAAPSARSGG